MSETLRWICAAVLAVGVYSAPSHAQELSDYALWRRTTVDLCSRLPTLDEINAIQANDDQIPENFNDRLRDCVESVDFASNIGLWLQDFALASLGVPVNQLHRIYQKTLNYTDGGARRRTYYWTGDTSNQFGWTDCMRGINVTSEAMLETYLDKAYEPFFLASPDAYYDEDEGGRFVWVCRATGTYRRPLSMAENACAMAGGYEAFTSVSLANEDEYVCRASQTGQFESAYCGFASNPTNFAPCGCGPNLRWCMPYSLVGEPDPNVNATDAGLSLFAATANDGNFEAQALAAYIVYNGLPFTDVFNASFAVRTARLQLFYDLMERPYLDYDVRDPDGCSRVIDVGQSTECGGTPTTNGEGWTTEGPTECEWHGDYLDFDDGDADRNASSDHAEATWCRIDLDADRDGDGESDLAHHQGGVLTSIGFLRRQVNETNVAGRVYPFFLCEDIGWRPVEYRQVGTATGRQYANYESEYWYETLFDTEAGEVGEVGFSTLYRTVEALVPFDGDHDETCAGCHMQVNPLAAFRNRWDTSPRYNLAGPDDLYPAIGVFRGRVAEDMTGLGDLLANDPVVQRCIINRHVELLTGHRLDVDDAELDSLYSNFVSSGHDMRDLYLDIVSRDIYRRPE